MKRSEIDAALTGLLPTGWFARQPRGFRQKLLECASEMRFADGDWLYGTDEEAGGLFAILEGSVHLLAALERGDTTLVDVVGRGNWFGQVGLLPDSHRVVTAVAAEPVTALVVPRSSLSRLLSDDPLLWRSFAALDLEQMQYVLNTLVETLSLPPGPRIAARLLALGARNSATPRLALRLTQTQLGEMTGLERKTVNRVLKALEARALVRTRYGTIEILDAGALARFRNLPERPSDR